LLQEIGDDVIRDRRETGKARIFTNTWRVCGLSDSDEKNCISDRNLAKLATLSNGLRVVIIQDSLAPVVTVEMNVLAGGNESPPEYPGMAHAQEHMAFRGCTEMTSDQTAAIYAELGGQDDADTEQNVTHYYTTVPSVDLDVALQAQAACMRGIDNSQEEWSEERGAIEQEVAEDLSDPWYRLTQRIKQDMFAGTAYIQDPLGTRAPLRPQRGRCSKSSTRTGMRQTI
jgi:zinc protease